MCSLLPRRCGLLCLLLCCARATVGRCAEPTAALPAAPVLYLFAHQDDEVFVLGKMRREVLEGREVHALWITDGARDGNAAHRARESRDVMALVGVPAARLYFLGFPDHASVRHLGASYDQISAIVGTRPFAEIDSPAYEGGNIDHDVAALMGALVTELPCGPLAHLEFPLYNRYQKHERYGVFLPNAATAVNVEPLDADRRTLVLAALKLYRSQRVLLTVLGIVGHKKALLDRGEPLRTAPPYDFESRPVNETCAYEVRGLHRAKFGDWVAAVEPFLRAHLRGPG